MLKSLRSFDFHTTRAIEQIDPDYIVPIHTKASDWFAESIEDVVLVDEGKTT